MLEWTNKKYKVKETADVAIGMANQKESIIKGAESGVGVVADYRDTRSKSGQLFSNWWATKVAP